MVWCGSQDLSQALTHAGIMTLRESSREVKSHTPQPIVRPRGSPHQQKQSNGLWISHSWDAFKQSRLSSDFRSKKLCTNSAYPTGTPRIFHPLLARGRDASPFHTTASGLTLRVHELVLVNELVLPESSIVTVELVLSRMKLPDVKMTRRVVLYTYCPVGAWVAHPKETTHRGQSPPGNNSPGSVAHKRTCLAALNNTWLAPGFTSQHLHKGKELTGYGVPRSTARLPAFRGSVVVVVVQPDDQPIPLGSLT